MKIIDFLMLIVVGSTIALYTGMSPLPAGAFGGALIWLYVRLRDGK